MTVCASCGATIDARFRVCGMCGQPLATGESAPEIRRKITIVQSDLKGSTALGEKLDPESLREVLTMYFDAMRAVFDAHEGTIEKIIGDAIIAVFGLPRAREDDSRRAVEAAYETIGALAELNDRLEATWGVRLTTRTGVATGEVVVGETSAGERVLTGDAVLIAGKLEQSCPPLGVQVSSWVVKELGDDIDVERLDDVLPKGFTDPVPAYQLLGVRHHDPSGDAPAEVASQGRLCPNCGEENEPDFAYCGTCGRKLDAQPKAQETRRTVTVIFSDLKATTDDGLPLSPEDLRDVMVNAFDASKSVLEQHGATVEKFIGDAIMAVFGIPVRHEDDALRAVRSALDMRDALASLAERLLQERSIRLDVAIGVNTGEVVAGDASLGQRLVSGDIVNVAARLEQAAPVHQVLIGDLTYRLVRDAVTVEAVAPLTLKGKAEPVPAYRLTKVGSGEAVARRQDTPMVGRETEMALLAGVYTAARVAHGGRAITVVGSAGVGKTRLVREFLDHVASEARILRGKCLPYGQGITFWPIVELVRRAAAIQDDDTPDEARAKIATLLPAGHDDVLERVFSTIGLLDTQFRIDELFWGVRRFLELLGAERPVVVLFDDIHWAEATFLDLIRYLLDSVQEAAVTVLCTARNELLESHADWGEGAHQERIVLAPLTDTDTGLIIENLLGRAGLDATVRSRVVEAAEGNPLFVEQLLSMLIDNGTLRSEGDHWVAVGDLSKISIPPTVHALIAARLDQLPGDERAVMEPASVIGLSFAEAAVEELSPDETRPVVPVKLVALSTKEMIRLASQPGDDERVYRFQHLLVRDAAYQGLLKRSRAIFHERFVEWAERVNRARGRETEFEEILGYHLEQAYRYRRELGPLDAHGVQIGERASDRLGSAGQRALERGDFPAAANLLRRASELLGELHARRPRLLVAAGEAFMEIGEFATADELLVSASSLATMIGLASLATTAQLLRLQLQLRSEASTSADEVMQKAIEAMGDLALQDDAFGLSRAWRLMEMLHGTAGRYGAAADANAKAILQARRAKDRVLEMRLYASSALGILLGPTPVPDGIARCEDLLRQVGSDRRAQAVTLASLSHLRGMAGEFDRARDDYRRGRAILEELGLKFDAAIMSLDYGLVELMANEPGLAEVELQRDYDALDAMGERNYISSTAGLLAEALWRQARFEEAARYASFCKEVASPGDVFSQYLWRGVEAKLTAREGSTDDAIALAQTGVTETQASDDIDTQGNALMFLAETQLIAGRLDDARRTAEQARRAFETKGDVVSAERATLLVPTSPIPTAADVGISSDMGISSVEVADVHV
ncbi:MAG TPA: adenylate/guanylate cyclase domain-containing protein [Candidatus Limnocylindrales bacterium]